MALRDFFSKDKESSLNEQMDFSSVETYIEGNNNIVVNGSNVVINKSSNSTVIINQSDHGKSQNVVIISGQEDSYISEKDYFNQIDIKDQIRIFYEVSQHTELFENIQFVDEEGYFYEQDEEGEKLIEFISDEKNQEILLKYLSDNNISIRDLMQLLYDEEHDYEEDYELE